jgi:holo-[acyl-carrier protein] synthase
MNIKGIGCDILELNRFKKALKRKGKEMLNRLLTKNEQSYCFKFKDPYPHLAVRFAGKEAIVKALGVGFGKDLGFLDIEILNDNNGKPLVKISKKISLLSNFQVLITLIHCKDYVMAVAIIQ